MTFDVLVATEQAFTSKSSHCRPRPKRSSSRFLGEVLALDGCIRVRSVQIDETASFTDFVGVLLVAGAAGGSSDLAARGAVQASDTDGLCAARLSELSAHADEQRIKGHWSRTSCRGTQLFLLSLVIGMACETFWGPEQYCCCGNVLPYSSMIASRAEVAVARATMETRVLKRRMMLFDECR